MGCHDHHLYATFVFDQLEGIMRMAPREAMKTRPLGKFRLRDFEKACELDPDAEPVPRTESWVMRWRAKEGGVRLGALINNGFNDSFTISMDEESTLKDFIGVKINFAFDFGLNAFKFGGDQDWESEN
jgi:hypothetical protein